MNRTMVGGLLRGLVLSMVAACGDGEADAPGGSLGGRSEGARNDVADSDLGGTDGMHEMVDPSSGVESSGAGGLSSGLDTSLELADLDEVQARQVCLWTEALLAEPSLAPVDACEASALESSDTDSREACDAWVERCLQNIETMDAPADGSSDTDTCEDAARNIPDGCSATVGELERCLSDSLAASHDLRERLQGLSCADHGSSMVPLDTAQEPPESCRVLEARCPGFSGGSE